MIRSFQFWIELNASNRKHLHGDRWWTYNTPKGLQEQFPFWSRWQIRRILKSLVDQQVLIVGNFNKFKYDRTTWYAFENQEKWLKPAFWAICGNANMDVAKSLNGCSGITTPIPVANTVTNQLEDQEREIDGVENTPTDDPPDPPDPPEVKKFSPPTVDELNAYILEKDLLATNAEEFIDFYESKNWMVGRNKMKSWHAAARGWNRRQVTNDNANAAKNFNEWNRAPW